MILTCRSEEECEEFLENLSKADKKFQEKVLKWHRSVTRLHLLHNCNNIEEYMQRRRKDGIYIDYYDVCKVLGVEPEDIREKDTMSEKLDKRMAAENAKHD